jgi:hypothetical protein
MNHQVPVTTFHLPGGELESCRDRRVKENDMALGNEQLVRNAYQIAEDKDMTGWAAAFTEDGTFTVLRCLRADRRQDQAL